MCDGLMVRTTEELRHQGPTGVSRRRTRITDTETEERMIQAALDPSTAVEAAPDLSETASD
jgi:hypothetical protein